MMQAISVVIPTLNEATVIHKTLTALAAQKDSAEVIIADGGSADATKELAAGLAKVIDAPKGRAVQMNAGARAATGDILLFLHADSLLPADAFAEIRRICGNPETAGGGFSLAFDDPSFSFRLIEWGSNVRARRLGLIFGDQGIFVRRTVFERMGGFMEMPLMEDWDFSRRLKKEGSITLSGQRIITSSRRFRKHGIWRTVWRMQVIKLLYLIGVPPERLSRMYEKTP